MIYPAISKVDLRRCELLTSDALACLVRASCSQLKVRLYPFPSMPCCHLSVAMLSFEWLAHDLASKVAEQERERAFRTLLLQPSLQLFQRHLLLP